MKPIITKVPKCDFDYIKIYAINLNKNPKLFAQQKMLIESQLKASRELFKKRFGTKEIFKINARRYLKSIGKI